VNIDDEAQVRLWLDRGGVTPNPVALTPAQMAELQASGERAVERILAPHQVRSPRRIRKFTVLASGFATAMIATLVLVVVPNGSVNTAHADRPPLLEFDGVPAGEVPSTGRPARDALELLAMKASQQQALPQDGDVQFINVAGWWTSSVEEPNSTRMITTGWTVSNQRYLYPDSSLRSIERRGTHLQQNGQLAEHYEKWRNRPSRSDSLLSESSPDPQHLETLPTNVNDLAEALIGDPVGCALMRGHCMIGEIIALHTSLVVQPEVRERLWLALATEPSVQFLGKVKDRAGREAVAFTAAAPGRNAQSIIFASPTTGQYLGDEMILIGDDPNFSFKAPAVLSYTMLLDARFVSAEDVPSDENTKRY
jgi:hypothetical protein